MGWLLLLVSLLGSLCIGPVCAVTAVADSMDAPKQHIGPLLRGALNGVGPPPSQTSQMLTNGVEGLRTRTLGGRTSPDGPLPFLADRKDLRLAGGVDANGGGVEAKAADDAMLEFTRQVFIMRTLGLWDKGCGSFGSFEQLPAPPGSSPPGNICTRIETVEGVVTYPGGPQVGVPSGAQAVGPPSSPTPASLGTNVPSILGPGQIITSPGGGIGTGTAGTTPGTIGGAVTGAGIVGPGGLPAPIASPGGIGGVGGVGGGGLTRA